VTGAIVPRSPAAAPNRALVNAVRIAVAG